MLITEGTVCLNVQNLRTLSILCVARVFIIILTVISTNSFYLFVYSEERQRVSYKIITDSEIFKLRLYFKGVT
jgi:hypothetical protein